MRFSDAPERRISLSTVVFITGPPGSGKSTVGRLVAEHFPKGLHLQVDQLREMMVSGIALPPRMTDETVLQFQLARSTATHMAQLYASEGVDVVIDDVCVPDELVDQYAALFANPLVHRVLLMPTLGALTERVIARGGPFAEFFVEYAPTIYGYVERLPLDGWLVLDTSDWTVEQTVQEVLSRIGATGSDTRTH